MCVRISTCFTTTGKFVTLQLRTFFVSSFLLATFTSVSIYSGQSGTGVELSTSISVLTASHHLSDFMYLSIILLRCDRPIITI